MTVSETMQIPFDAIWWLIVLVIIMFLAINLFFPDSLFLLSKMISTFRVG